jgi:hypothetical protein
MRSYSPSPDFAEHSEETPFVTVTTSDQVCAADPYTIRFPSKENRYIAALTLFLTDDEMDFLIEAIAAARAERLMQQEQTYEALHAKFAGPFNNHRADEDDAREYAEVVRLEADDSE